MGSHSSVDSIHPLDFHSFATSIRSYTITCIQTLSFRPQAIQNHVKYLLKRWAPCKQVPSSLTQLHHRKQIIWLPKRTILKKKCALENNDVGPKINILEKGRINPLWKSWHWKLFCCNADWTSKWCNAVKLLLIDTL